MNKIAKRIVAGVSAMALAFSSMAMTASANEGTGRVNGVPVEYSTSITEKYSLSTSYFGANPFEHDFKLQLDITYQYKNQRNGELTTSHVITEEASGGGTGRQIQAPANCTMTYADTYHYFWADDVYGQYHSRAIL